MLAAPALGLALLASTLTAAAASAPTTTESDEAKPTVVLVHGAFADASGWSGVTKRLERAGYPVLSFANPLRSLAGDAEYLRAFLGTIEGEIVLVGHSYGGAVITNAATGNPDVEALVYIAAYALDEGETLGEATELGGGHSDLGEHLVVRPYPGAGEGDADGYIDPAFFHRLFAKDLPRSDARVLASAQRPLALSIFGTPSGPPAWASIPSWYLVAAKDKAIPPEAERAMAERAGAETVEINSSHAAMISNPEIVTDLILDAATSH